MPSKNRLRSRASRRVLPCALACALAFACIVRCPAEQPAATAKQHRATTERAPEGVEYWADNDAEAVHKWYAHITQIPLIGNTFVPGSDAEDALMRKVQGFEKLERLTPAQFRERNYPVAR